MRKRIKNFEGYEIDENGDVFSLISGKKLKQQIQRNGYAYVGLYKNGVQKTCRVHRLVAMAFINNPDNLPCVNHKDENKTNNNYSNLEWCSYKYNNFYGKSEPTIQAINARKKGVIQYDLSMNEINEFESACEAERKTKVHQANISKCCLGRAGFITAGGFIWRFK